MPAQGGQAKTGPQFNQATTEALRLCDESLSELDFRMIDTTAKNLVNAASLVLPYADNWQNFHN